MRERIDYQLSIEFDGDKVKLIMFYDLDSPHMPVDQEAFDSVIKALQNHQLSRSKLGGNND